MQWSSILLLLIVGTLAVEAHRSKPCRHRRHHKHDKLWVSSMKEFSSSEGDVKFIKRPFNPHLVLVRPAHSPPAFIPRIPNYFAPPPPPVFSAPSYSAPQSYAPAPAPYEQPAQAPVYNSPPAAAPVYETPAQSPVYQQAAPAYEAPAQAPVYNSPPAAAPVYEAPVQAPVYQQQSAPTYEAPAAAPSYQQAAPPAPVYQGASYKTYAREPVVQDPIQTLPLPIGSGMISQPMQSQNIGQNQLVQPQFPGQPMQNQVLDQNQQLVQPQFPGQPGDSSILRSLDDIQDENALKPVEEAPLLPENVNTETAAEQKIETLPEGEAIIVDSEADKEFPEAGREVLVKEEIPVQQGNTQI